MNDSGKQIADKQVNLEHQLDSFQLAKGGGIKLVGNVFNRGLYALIQIVLARLLGPSEFGLFSIGWTILQTGGLFNQLGLHQAVLRFGTQFWKTDSHKFKRVIWQTFGFVSFLGLLTAGLLYQFAPWISDYIFHNTELIDVLRGFSLSLLFLPVLNVVSAATRISRRMQFSTIAEDIIPPLIQLLMIGVFVFLNKFNISAVILSIGLSLLIGLIFGLFFIFKLFPELLTPDDGTDFILKDLLSFSLVITLASVFTNFTTRIDRLLLGYFTSISHVGVYQTASQGAILVGSILVAFNAMFSPMIAKLFHQGKMGRLNELFIVSTKWSLYLSIPFFLLIMIFPEDIISVVFGDIYYRAAGPLRVLAVGQIISVSTGAVGMLHIMTGHHLRWFYLTVMSFLINVSMNIFLIPRFGMVGAAVGTTCAIGTLYILGLLSVRGLLNLWPYDRRYFKGLTAAVVTVISLFFINSFSWTNSLIKILVSTSIAVSVYMAVLLIQRLEPEEIQIWNALKIRLNR